MNIDRGRLLFLRSSFPRLKPVRLEIGERKKKKEKGTIREASVITVMERCLLIESSRREKESEREREETEENA